MGDWVLGLGEGVVLSTTGSDVFGLEVVMPGATVNNGLPVIGCAEDPPYIHFRTPPVVFGETTERINQVTRKSTRRKTATTTKSLNAWRADSPLW